METDCRGATRSVKPCRVVTPAARRFHAALVVLAASAVAQDPAVPPPTAPSQQPPGITIDRVLGVIGDQAILESGIRGELLSRVESWRNTHNGQSPTQEQVEQWQRLIVRALTQKEAMAQAARTMKGTTPENVDRLFERIFDDYQRERIERAGSYSKLTEEFGVLGETWESVREEKRTETLVALAQQQQLSLRFRDRWALMVTPQEMQHYYDSHPDEFVAAAAADLEVLAIRNLGDDASRARAEQARALWQAGNTTADAIAAQLDASVLAPQEGVRAIDSDPRAPEFRAFAATAKPGDVSAPLPRGEYLMLLRCSRRREARQDRFDDPDVQARILDHLLGERMREIELRLMLKSEQTHQFIPVPRRR